MSRGFVIDQQSQLENLIERGLFADADDMCMTGDEPPAPPPETLNPFWLWDDMHAKLVYLLKYAASEDSLPDKISNVAALAILLADKDPPAALAAILLKDASRYAFTHSLHVAVLAAVVSRVLRWPEDVRRELVCGALTMNVAMIRLQTKLLSQQTPLTDEQRAQIALHPAQGCDLLTERGVTNARWLGVVRWHHTRTSIDESLVQAPDERAMAELTRVLDIYCAKISPRAYRPAMLPPLAAKELYVQERAGTGVFVDALIKQIGIYMPGSFVKLASGETAIVIGSGRTAGTPIVVALSRGDGMPYIEGLKRDTAHSAHAIKSVVSRDKIMQTVNLAKLWGY